MRWVVALTLRPRVHDNLRHHSEKEEFEQTKSKAKVCPVMTILHDFEAVAFEIDLAIKVHLMKCFHWNPVFARIFYPVALIMEMEIVLYGSTRIPSFLVLTR